MSNRSNLPSVYEHADPKSTLLPSLSSFLPYCIPLYRRLQFGQSSPHAHILATIASNDTGTKELGDKESLCIGAAYVDRSRRPETEAWFFLSHDSPNHSAAASSCTCTMLLLALLDHISTLPYPAISAEEEADAFAAVNRADSDTASKHHTHTAAPAAAYLTNLHDAVILKAGTLHSRSVQELMARDCVRMDMPGANFPYRKYIFAPKADATTTATAATADTLLSRNLRCGTLSEEALDLVRSRTAIPRTNRTLRTLPSAAIFPNTPGAAPIAWAFLGPDASLTSLHVEPEYRGQGLAKVVAGKLFREGLRAFEDRPGGFAHADVAVDNDESNGVCKSLGGTDGWKVYWVRIDLDRVRSVVYTS